MAQNKAKAAARADTSQANPPAIIQQAQNQTTPVVNTTPATVPAINQATQTAT